MESKSTDSDQPANAAEAGRVIPDEPSESNPPAARSDDQLRARGGSRRFYTASLLGFFAKLPPLPPSSR